MREFAFLLIKNFDRFQHYKDRNPPWIKLYTALLSDPEFLNLPEAAQAQLLKLWLLAAQMGNPIPNQPRLLAGKIWVTGRFYLKELIAAGFLIPSDSASADASTAASRDASTSASTKDPDSASADASPSRARTRVRARSRELELEGRERGSVVQESDNQRSSSARRREKRSDHDELPSRELKAAVQALPSEARDFLGTFWPATTTPASVRIEKAREIVATLNGGAPFKRSRVRALSPHRLATKCLEVLRDPPRDASKAMAVLLTKLADVGNAQDSPSERAAAAEKHDERHATVRFAHASAWLETQPEVADAIDAAVAKEMPADTMAPIVAVYRQAAVLKAWTDAGEPIVQPAGNP